MKKGKSYVELLDSDGWKILEVSNQNKSFKPRRVNKRNYKVAKFSLKGILFFLILLVIIGPFTYARFFHKSKPTNKISVATWSFKIGNSKNNYSIDLADTIIKNEYSTTKVVPGSCGIIQFDIDFSSTKVDALYNISIDDEKTNVPSNLKFYIDDGYSQEFVGFSGEVSLDNINNSLVKRIYWRWDYTEEDENYWANKEITLHLVTEAKQIN